MNTSSNILDFIKSKKDTTVQPTYPDNLSAKGSVSSSIHNEEADKVYSLLEDDDKNIWSGFVTRNK